MEKRKALKVENNNNLCFPRKSKEELMSDASTATEERIRVVCRVRPLNAQELDLPLTIVDANRFRVAGDGMVTATLPISETQTRSLAFKFSSACGALASQSDVYAVSAQPLVAKFVRGINCCVMSYGATSSGKTHTMLGRQFADDGSHELGTAAHAELVGLIPRMLDDIFNLLLHEATGASHELRCTFLEVYCEQIYDLLDGSRPVQELRENRGGEVMLPSARSELATSVADVLALLERGSQQRKVACTNANRESSRGHVLFIVTLRRTDADRTARESQLYMCDLAGSEKIKKTGVEGINLKEAAAINQSLLALGNVIQALSSGNSAQHVPYRSSKLTRLLKAPLTSATVMIVCVSPSSLYGAETVASLRFGDRTQLIKGRATVNTVRSVEFLEAALARAQARINELEKMLGGRSPSADDDNDDDNDDDDNSYDDELASQKHKLLMSPAAPHTPPNRLSVQPQELFPQVVPEAMPRHAPSDLVLFVCPLSKRIFNDPVVAADGVTYERVAIENLLRASAMQRAVPTSPALNRPLEHGRLVSNLLVKAQLRMRFQELQRDDGGVLPFDWVFQDIVLEAVIGQLKTINCVMAFRGTCRRFRKLIDTKYILCAVAVRFGVMSAAECAAKTPAALVAAFLKRAARKRRGESALVVSGLKLKL